VLYFKKRDVIIVTIGLVLSLLSPAMADSVRTTVQSDNLIIAQAAIRLPSSETGDNGKLRALAEPFEKLTEISFSATLPKIDEVIGESEVASDEARGLLSKDVFQEMNIHMMALKNARMRKDRAEMALSSIEVFRVLVSTVADNTKVPNAVGLLDYAGFRYNADLKANPVRWDDMAKAVYFARENWAKLLPEVKSSGLETTIEKTLLDMENAVVQKRKSLAASSVKAELDLVDQLENFFSSQSGVTK
jgi:hypothetical protein